ncbi:hypothetical protein CGLAMM_05870 [Acetobacteraceae bacterium EV16G]
MERREDIVPRPLMTPEMIVDAVPCAMEDLPDQALPSLMRKCLALAKLPA